QPGSAFKPFVYIAALESGMTPDDTVVDGPISVGDWRPRNFDGQFAGAMSLRDSLARSINTIAVQLSERLGRDKVIEVARLLGITSNLKPHPSLALGAFEVGVLELTAAYAAFANGGYAVQPYGVLEIRDTHNTLLFRRKSGGAYAHMLPPEILGDMNGRLSAVMEQGTGRAARIGRPAAGKTGTTSDYRDAWFVGYTPDLIASVWVGNDDNSAMKKVTGSGVPAQAWRAFMMDALKGKPVRALPEPPARMVTLPSLWDRIVRQFGGSASASARSAEPPPPPQPPVAQISEPPVAGGGTRMNWQTGPQPVNRQKCGG